VKPIYLDYNATTPIDPKVAEAMLPYIHEHFGNPSSSHAFGAAARLAVEKARGQVAAMLHCAPEEIVFTSGGTESNNYAIKGAAYARRERGNHIITSAVEHPAVTEVCKYLERDGFRTTFLPVGGDGLVSVDGFERAITPATILVSIMHANNEVGTIQPVREIAEIARGRGILVHTDAAQSAGKIPVRVDELGVDLLSLAGHKLYAPKGIGALYVRTETKLEKLMHGANHEANRRAGTENVIEIAGVGEACALIGQNLENYGRHMKAMRDRLEAGIKEKLSDVRINGHLEKRLPNTASVSFRGLEANALLSGLTGVAASAGAACHSGEIKVSTVLEAMSVPAEYAMGTVRFSAGRTTTAAEIDSALTQIVEAAGKMRQDANRG
jgi:cysteine desulfurase